MSASVVAQEITVHRGRQLVLDGVSVALDPGHRVGLVGPNGVGKSTLLSVIAGFLAPDSGRIDRRPREATVGLLSQEPERRAGETVREMVSRRTGVSEVERELDAATDQLSTGIDLDGANERYAAVLDRWVALGAADFESRLSTVWADLGLDDTRLDRSTDVLSGGEAARASLAVVMLARFDVLLLDEPTNDLDLDGLERLERFVTASPQAMLVVSHDRTFLERVVTDVVEIDEQSHRSTSFAGGWQSYQDERGVARQHASERFSEYSAKRADLAGRAQREREWATQGASKAKKKPTDNDKHVKAFKVDQTEQLAGRAARTQRQIDRLEVVEKPWEGWRLSFRVGTSSRSGDLVASLTGAVVERGSFTLGPVSLEVGWAERMVIVGSNGSGKSTLLGALLGQIPLAAGRQRVGPSVRIGELDQARRRFDSHQAASAEQTIGRLFMDGTGLTVSDTRTLLAKFGIDADRVDRPASTLSPGERTRATLALLQANEVNCLVLDEPTNHLDLPAIEQLELALDEFPGTVLLVSHDRRLLERVSVTRQIELRHGQVVSDRTC
jgi:ATPase subunit of ABC transporter with duplicated ATPase domains